MEGIRGSSTNNLCSESSPKWVLKGRKVGGSDIQLISVVKQIFFPDKSKLASKII